MDQINQTLDQLSKRLDQLKTKFNLSQKLEEISQLEQQSQASNFWEDDSHARAVMRKLSGLQEEVKAIKDLDRQVKEISELLSMSGDQLEPQLKTDLDTQLNKITNQLDKLEIKIFLSGPHDRHHAILSLHAGQGGTEAQDWVAMLLRMYTRYIEDQGWQFELVEESPGEEAGLKSVTLLVKGAYAYGYLKHEQGTHRLVRQSPFNADNLRQTSFALVEVLPELPADAEIDVKDDDLEWQFFRSSGKGGQNVNKVSTAVRVKHKPTNIVVESQAQRTQVQNRQIALSILKAKLWDRQQQQSANKLQKIKGEYHPATWGTQIRSYVLHPYHLVKDLRTDVETNDTQAVLDGNLDLFIEAEIRQL